MTYLHGSETKEIDVQGRPFTVVLSSVVGFIGIAPKGPVNELTVVSTPAQAIELFGPEIPGFNLPEAMAAHFAEGGGVVLVINTFTPENTAAVASEAVTVADGRVALEFAPYNGVVVLKSTDGNTTLTLGTDYKVNAYGAVTILNRLAQGGYPDGTALKASYTKLDPATVTSPQIIGTSDGVTRTGSYLFETARSKFGFNAMILAAPGYSAFVTVANRLTALAEKYSAVALIDAPFGTTVTAALNGRSPAAPLGGFGSQSERVLLCYPYWDRPDPAVPVTDSNPDPRKLVPMSAVAAGIMSATDLTLGVWYSHSNKVSKESKQLEVLLSAAVNDPTTDVQILNAAGICTGFAGYGSGLRTYGARSAAFPANAQGSPEQRIRTFLCVRRTADIIERTIELNMLPYIDAPLSLADLDTIRQKVNSYLADLRMQGGIIGGTCFFLAEDNSLAALAAGNPVFSYEFLPPPPMERISFKAKLKVDLLQTLLA